MSGPKKRSARACKMKSEDSPARPALRHVEPVRGRSVDRAVFEFARCWWERHPTDRYEFAECGLFILQSIEDAEGFVVRFLVERFSTDDDHALPVWCGVARVRVVSRPAEAPGEPQYEVFAGGIELGRSPWIIGEKRRVHGDDA